MEFKSLIGKECGFRQFVLTLITKEVNDSYPSHYYRVLKNNREKENDLVAMSRAERGIARHFLIDRLEACPTNLHHAPILIGYRHKILENFFWFPGSDGNPYLPGSAR